MRSSLHRCLQRHDISRLPEVEGDKPAKKTFKAYPLGYFRCADLRFTLISQRFRRLRASCISSWPSVARQGIENAREGTAPPSLLSSNCTRRPEKWQQQPSCATRSLPCLTSSTSCCSPLVLCFSNALRNSGANALRVVRRALVGRVAPLLVTLGRP